MTKLEQLLNELGQQEGITVEGYGDENYINRLHGQYTLYIGEFEGEYELGTYKDMDNEDMANMKTVKTLRGVKTFINKFL